VNDNDNDNDTTEISNDSSYPSDCGALLIEPAPPERGTFTLLLPENFTWGVRRRNGAIRLNFREIRKTPVRSENVEHREGED